MTNIPRRASKRAAIPQFSLYGEAPAPERELLHIEAVESRSRLYRWEIKPHVHRGLYQILWLRSGQVDIVLDEWRGALAGPGAIVAPPGVIHGFRFAPETDGFVLTLSPRFLLEGGEPGQAFRALFAAPAAVAFDAEDPAVERLDRLVRELEREFAAPGAPASPVPLWLARAVVWRLAQARAFGERRTAEQGRRHHGLHGRFLLLVEQHFLERWPLERYAKALGLSTQRLNRLARAESGRSALEIVHERLTREACRRLAFIAAPAEKLAAELGFDDPAYFVRFFKRRTGMTPKRWREQQRAEP